jgi:glycosyltransferase involved in cell wall biosynthesis
MNHVIIIGPAHPLRGGLASFNERLAKQFQQEGYRVSIFTFSLQYPSFLFPGTSQYSAEPAPEGIDIKEVINSINPFNWVRTGYTLKQLRPDIIVVRYWLPFMAPCLGTILRLAKANKHTRIVTIADNILPHEKRPGDSLLTKYFIGAPDAFITMSDKVTADLRKFSNKKTKQVVHPLYDNFGTAVETEEARRFLNLPEQERIILFFGFIRKYKGLDLLLKALHLLVNNGFSVKLLIAGEFYEDADQYTALIEKWNLSSHLYLRTHFIPDSDVRYYLSAADFVIQPYRSATQSGVTPLAYHFEKPMLVTNVGGLPDMVPHDKAGIVTEPDAAAIAAGIENLYNKGQAHFLPAIREEKRKYNWHSLVDAITSLADT